MTSKHHYYLEEFPKVNRWFKNLERGSPITAEVALKRLSRICEILNLNPDDIIETARNDLTSFQDMMEDREQKA